MKSIWLEYLYCKIPDLMPVQRAPYMFCQSSLNCIYNYAPNTPYHFTDWTSSLGKGM